jgi:hypothetical protein
MQRSSRGLWLKWFHLLGETAQPGNAAPVVAKLPSCLDRTCTEQGKWRRNVRDTGSRWQSQAPPPPQAPSPASDLVELAAAESPASLPVALSGGTGGVLPGLARRAVSPNRTARTVPGPPADARAGQGLSGRVAGYSSADGGA